MTEPTGPRKAPGFLTEDLHPVTTSSPDDYAYETSGDVLFSPVEDGGVLQGYLWADDDADAMEYVAAAAAGDDGINTGTSWMDARRAARARGLRPSQALSELAAHGGGDGVAGPVAGPIPFADLERLAGPPPADRAGNPQRGR